MDAASGRWQARLESLFERSDALWGSVDARLDAAAGQSPRAWIRYLAVALAGTLTLALLLQLLLAAALRGGAGWRWCGVAVAGLLALLLLGVVIRNVVISIAEPAHRRSLLVALLTSAAAVLTSVVAFAAATVALAGGQAGLIRAERFYLWCLVDAVPLLDLPHRIGWTEPNILNGLDGRLLVLAFTVTVIPPLVRLVVAVYELAEHSAGERRYARAIAERVRGPRSYTFVDSLLPHSAALVAAAAVAWSWLVPWAGVGPQLLSRSGIAFLAALVGVAIVAAVAGAAVELLYEQPLTLTLAAAVGLVWFDTAARRTAFPGLVDVGTWGRIGATLAIWAVLSVLVLIIWEEPELPQTALALVLVLGFVGADPPLSRWLVSTVGWQPWGFALGPALAAAGVGLTVGYLAHLMWRLPRLTRMAGTFGLGPIGVLVRVQLRTYLSVAMQIVIVAGAILAVLESTAAAGRTGSADRSGAAVALPAALWHVTDSLPGPDVVGILQWRLTADVTGRWAGLTVVVALLAIIVFAVFPAIRTTTMWARLSVDRPGAVPPLVQVPAGLLQRLRAAVDSMAESPRPEQTTGLVGPRDPLRRLTPFAVTAFPASAEVEQHLVAAELDRRVLLDLFGAESPIHLAAGAAIDTTTAVYRTRVQTRAPARGLLAMPRRNTPEATLDDARTAVDAFERQLATPYEMVVGATPPA